jgi:hypothetical protein
MINLQILCSHFKREQTKSSQEKKKQKKSKGAPTAELRGREMGASIGSEDPDILANDFDQKFYRFSRSLFSERL